MASRIVVRNGIAHGVYDDKFFCIFEALGAGTPIIHRATDVEFDRTTAEWVATHIASGKVIGRGKNRSEVIKQEVTWLEREEI